MSLILDALKKSEAERQLGRAPGLMSPMQRVSRRRGLSPWWGVLGLALAALGFAWWTTMQRNAPAPDRTVHASGTASAVEAQQPAVAASEAGTASPTPSAPPAPALAEATPPAQPAENAALLPRDPEFDSIERESLPVATRAVPAPASLPPAAEPVVAARTALAPASLPSAEDPVAAVAAPSTVPPLATDPAPSAASTLPPTPATTLPAAAPAIATPSVPTASTPPEPASTPSTAEAPPPPAEPPLEALPSVAELPPEVRNALPPLKLSMHVYNATPAARFVLIDGKRYAQGERIAGSLLVEEIRRDGAVLDFDGKRFLVPRP